MKYCLLLAVPSKFATDAMKGCLHAASCLHLNLSQDSVAAFLMLSFVQHFPHQDELRDATRPFCSNLIKNLTISQINPGTPGKTCQSSNRFKHVFLCFCEMKTASIPGNSAQGRMSICQRKYLNNESIKLKVNSCLSFKSFHC